MIWLIKYLKRSSWGFFNISGTSVITYTTDLTLCQISPSVNVFSVAPTIKSRWAWNWWLAAPIVTATGLSLSIWYSNRVLKPTHSPTSETPTQIASKYEQWIFCNKYQQRFTTRPPLSRTFSGLVLGGDYTAIPTFR